MAESDEDKYMLDDESMDEMHELGDELIESVDTNASPVKPQLHKARSRHGDADHKQRDGDSDSGNDSDASSELFGGDSSSSSSSDEESAATTTPHRHVERRPGPELRKRTDVSEDEDDEDDGPPEIPGSPLRISSSASSSSLAPGGGGGRMNRLSDLDISNCGEVARQRSVSQQPTVDFLAIHHDDDDDSSEQDDDYETKETEAPRAMELFSSGSSSSESANDENSEQEEENADGLHGNGENQSRLQPKKTTTSRPKTAAKDLEPYRDLMPTAYYRQIVDPASPVSRGPQKEQKEPSKKKKNRAKTHNEQQEPSAKPTTTPTNTSKNLHYGVHVPKEVQDLFHLVDAYKPDAFDLVTRLQPFIPAYIPTIGLPYDGIQIPRPDGKLDGSGIQFIREPRAQSSEAELQLLLAASTKKTHRRRPGEPATVGVDLVHSIDLASHRPREIDAWITSVKHIHSTKPPPQVLYAKPMPPLTELMALWPEEFEMFLASQPAAGLLPPVSQLDVDLPELIQIVCGVLDIPVYPGHHVQSLHVLFALYYEVVMYEKEMLGTTTNHQR